MDREVSTRLGGTTADVATLWEAAFAQWGTVPHQSLQYVRSASTPDAGGEVTVLRGDDWLSAFVRRGDRSECLVQGAGVLPIADQSSVTAFGDLLHWEVGGEVVSLPQLYVDLPTTRWVIEGLPGAATLERRPSPVIDWSDGGRGVWARCESRLGSRARRRRRRFEQSSLLFDYAHGQAAIDAVSAVERRSWKATLRQDMHTRRQFAFYKGLILSGTVDVRVAYRHEHPVAYRIDHRIGDILYCLKWSFDESARAISPGFALLVLDLPECHRDTPLQAVDLFGAADSLKDAISTGARRRVDLCWPDSPGARAILRERAAHDARNAAVHRSGKGIRWACAG